jgi:hypothetical protein
LRSWRRCVLACVVAGLLVTARRRVSEVVAQ